MRCEVLVAFVSRGATKGSAMKWLPKTEVFQLKLAVSVTAALFLLLATQAVITAVREPNPSSLLLALPLYVLAIFLWRMKSWAHKLTKALIGLLVIMFSVVVFMAPMASRGGTPNWPLLFSLYIPYIGFSAWLFWVFDKYKSEFH